MRLTQIRLAGFKSFVDPTAIHLRGALVGIVGPNGCGKSNIIDAVRWVLGESRASVLRGDSMQDVIFNGAAQRAPLARASVELLFDNSSGRAAGAWSPVAEISVKRVLQRDGESSYYINGTHVRRRDVTDMFLGTGLGPRAYAIIEQGMISRVIEARPEELRVFLEEAAGVSRYRERRRETEARLADARENLVRVNDIRGELAQRLETLEAQAAVAARYRELQQEVAQRQQLLWFMRRADAAAERERHAGELAKRVSETEAESARLRAIENEIESARAAHDRAGEALNAAQAALYAANADVARCESELRHAEDTRERLRSRHTERTAQLAAWREQRAELTRALHLWAARAVAARRNLEHASAQLQEEEARLPVAEQAWRLEQEQLAEARSRLLQVESRIELARANLAHVERALAGLAARAERLAAERAALEPPGGEAIETARAALAEARARQEQAKWQLDAAARRADETVQAREAAAAALAGAKRERGEVQARRAALEQVQAQAGGRPALEQWLARRGLASRARLWQRLRIEMGWEAAVEAVLGERLHAVEREAAPLQPLAAGERPPARASAYWRGAAPPIAPVGRVPLAAKVRAADPAAEVALAEWLAGVYACDRPPTESERVALEPGVTLVTPEGDRYTAHTVSWHAADGAETGVLARQAEIEALALRLAALEARVHEAGTVAASAEAETKRAAAELDAARTAVAACATAVHEAEIELVRLEQAFARSREHSARLEAATAELEDERRREQERLAQLRAEQERLAGELECAQQAVAARREAHSAAEGRLAGQRQALAQAERTVHEARFAERECASKIAEIDGAVQVIDQQIGHAEEELRRLAAELTEDSLPALRAALEAVVETRWGCERTLAGAREALEIAATALRAREEERMRVEARLAPLREQTNELRLREQAARLSCEQYELQLREAQADEQALARAAQAAPRPTTLQAEITRLGQAIAELGAVNLAALEELQAVRERKGYLDAQAADLEEAVRTMEEAIRRIDRETRERLRETFDSVNRHFGSLFPLLFGGGEARLVVIGDEILEAGVQVMAQPPGKRNTSIHLLSGGEKALAAIALVFALFQLNPAPFCLLDEVDAPLDDANVARYCDLVRRMSTQVQFVFVSHNKITMEMADQLVGVTMPESGVSRVVAVDIEEALRIREQAAVA